MPIVLIHIVGWIFMQTPFLTLRSRFVIWLKVSRANFIPVALFPFLVGSVFAWSFENAFSWRLLTLGLLGVFLTIVGTNLLNEYYDYKSGADVLNTSFNKFSGGSRVLPEGLLAPEKVVIVSLISFSLVFLIAIYLSYITTWVLLPLATFGIFSGAFYTASPIQTGYKGVGEFFIALSFGWLCVTCGYIVQTSSIAAEPQILSIPLSITVFLVILINELPDYQADKKAGKNTMVVKIGPEKSAKIYTLLTLLVYISIILITLFLSTLSLLLALLTLPIAIKSIQNIKLYEDHEILEKTCGMTIGIHILTSLLLIIGLVIHQYQLIPSYSLKNSLF